MTHKAYNLQSISETTILEQLAKQLTNLIKKSKKAEG